jgi:hypothetical protein
MDDSRELWSKRSRWQQALLSVYYHARRSQPSLARRRPPRHVIPLDHAVSALVAETHPQVLTSVRVALAELCRSRARYPHPVLVGHVRLLARKFGSLLPPTELGHLHDVASAHFEQIFEKPGVHPDTAYLLAIEKMQSLHWQTRTPALKRMPGLSKFMVAS